MVSVVVPVYNVEKYLKDCVESIYAQTFGDYELLLIDDCSTDDSGRLADELAARDARARVIHLAENGGLGPARNRGIRESIGKYITFIDSDDWVKPDYLDALVAAAETYHADVVWMGAEKYYPEAENGWRIAPQDRIPPQDARLTMDKKRRLELFADARFAATAWGHLISHRLFVEEQLRFEPILAEDTLFVFQLYHVANTILLLSRRGYCYRQRPGSIMREKSLEVSRKAMQSVLRVMPVVEHDIATWQEFAGDAALCHRIRMCFAEAYLQFWLRHSAGMRKDHVLAEAESVFLEMVPEQAGILNCLLDIWVSSLMKPRA